MTANANETNSVGIHLVEYVWEPFTFHGRHLTFAEHCGTRLSEANCSHWGAAVYKWEGLLTQGTQVGKVGVLIGETDDLRQRIKQYISGTQKSGNKYWRETFLMKGDVRLYILNVGQVKIFSSGGEPIVLKTNNLENNNFRLVLEQLLVLRENLRKDEKRWIVNRKLGELRGADKRKLQSHFERDYQ